MSVEVTSIIGNLQAGGNWPVVSVSLIAEINTWPTIQAEILPVQPGKGETSTLKVSSDIIKTINTIKNAQEANITFGTEKGPTSMSCIIKSVSMTVGIEDVIITVVMAPKYTKLDRYCLSFYKMISKEYDADAARDVLYLQEGDTFIKYLQRLCKYLKESWNTFRGPITESMSQTSKDALASMEQSNAQVEKYWDMLLNNSVEKVGNLYNMGKNYSDYDGTPIGQHFISILTEEKGSWLSTITDIAGVLGCVYVPGLDSEDVGYFLPKEKILESAAGSTQVPITSMTVNYGGLGVPDIGRVYAEVSLTQDHDGVGTINFSSAIYKSKNEKPGDTCLVAPKFKFIPTRRTQEQASTDIGDTTTPTGEPNVQVIGVKEWSGNATSVLAEWCKQVFCWQKATTSTAVVNTFFDSSPQLFGTRVSVQGLFTGFMSHYQQTVRKNLGDSGEAKTTFQLIGVEM